jgi:2-amino-4-hydroxy-6-hydroxymethyldihydropteridine diphosphokinase
MGEASDRSRRPEPVTAYVGLGSNLGDREANLHGALRALADTPEVRVLRCTPFRPTAPWGEPDQPEFLNAVAEVATSLPPRGLLQVVKRIEQQMGRVQSRRWGPRVIDIDILTYGTTRMATDELRLPHPYILQRPFVYEPLRELAPAVLEELERDAALSL